MAGFPSAPPARRLQSPVPSCPMPRAANALVLRSRLMETTGLRPGPSPALGGAQGGRPGGPAATGGRTLESAHGCSGRG